MSVGRGRRATPAQCEGSTTDPSLAPTSCPGQVKQNLPGKGLFSIPEGNLFPGNAKRGLKTQIFARLLPFLLK